MEKKTIGGFIAALRKANGMTQKDLADRLNVSDKTVSRWERDEGTPDLSLIPVIAEIFDVTCDELLRGARKSPEERAEPALQADTTMKGEKQRQRMLKATLSQYRSQTCIAVGVSAVGLLVALICNLAFLKAVLGFLCGAIFFAASIVCQAVFTNRAFLSVEDAGLEEGELSDFRRSVIGLAGKSAAVTVGCVGFTLPLMLVDAYMGLSGDNLLLFGAIGAGLSLLIYAVVCYFVNAAFIKKGTYVLEEREKAAYQQNHKLKRRCAIGLAAVLLVTFVGHQFATGLRGPLSIADGKTFYDYESFVAYMEQDIPYNFQEPSEISGAAPFDEFDNWGAEEFFSRTLKDKNGNVVCKYIERNRSVVRVDYTPKEGTALPITVYTRADMEAAQQKASMRHMLFSVAYVAEVAVVVLFYFRKRVK